MFVISTILVLIVSIIKQCQGQEDLFYYPKYEANLPLTGIINMTEELIKDAANKLIHSEKIQEHYKDSVNYELGSIAAGVQNTFKRMLQLYRTYGNQTEFEKHTFPISEMTYAFHLMQGYYNELRLERNLFFKTLDNYKKRQEKFKKRMRSRGNTARRMVAVTPILNVADKPKQNNNDQDYKQQLRHNVWKKKWNNFIPEIEGVDIELDNWN